jgi:hypothetical protein
MNRKLTALKLQQDQQSPWFLTSVTACFLQSILVTTGFLLSTKNTELFADLWSLSFSAFHESQVFFFGHVSKVVHGFIGTGDFSSSVLGIVLLSLGQILVEDGLTADFFQW